MESLLREEVRPAVRKALDEDIGSGDVTTLAIVPEAAIVQAELVARESLVVSGLVFAETAFWELSAPIQIHHAVNDGQHLAAGQVLLRIEGAAQPILTAERVALNFVQRLSGIATLTAQYVTAVAGTQARILDTRKTTPGWRRFEKYAVTCGGGQNHRFGLFDQFLIKDNHLAALKGGSPNPVAACIQRARQSHPALQVEVETDTLDQVRQAVEARADIILLDNMTIDELRAAVQIVNHRARTEASGGVSLRTVRAIAETGVDFISVGALTHSARAMDIALDFVS